MSAFDKAKQQAQPDPDAGDLYAETYLSRAPVLTVAQVNAFVQKVIAYETPADPSYLGNTLFLGEVLFPANWDSSQVITMDGGQLSEDIINSRITPAGGVVVRRYEDALAVTEVEPLLTYARSMRGLTVVHPDGLVRLAGPNRYDTAVAVSQWAFGTATTAFVATGEKFPDALTAGPVAARTPGPLLLSTPACLPTTVAAEIVRLGASRVVVLGGEPSLSAAITAGTRCPA